MTSRGRGLRHLRQERRTHSAEVDTEIEKVVWDKNLRSCVVSGPPPSPSNVITSVNATPNADNAKQEPNTTQVVEKNLRRQVVSHLSPAPTPLDSSLVTTPSATQDKEANAEQVFEKNLRSRVVSCQSPSLPKSLRSRSAAHPSPGPAILPEICKITGPGAQEVHKEFGRIEVVLFGIDKETDAQQAVSKNLRSRVVSCPSPGPIPLDSSLVTTPSATQDKEADSEQVFEKNLRCRVVSCQSPSLPKSLRSRSAAHPSPGPSIPETCEIIRPGAQQVHNDSGRIEDVQMVEKNLCSRRLVFQKPASPLHNVRTDVEQITDLDRPSLRREVPHHGLEDDDANAINNNNTKEETPHGFDDENTEQLQDERAPKGKNTRKRGLNRNLRLAREVRARKRDDPSNPETFKPQVFMPPNEHNPVGDWSGNFAREVGRLIRHNAPVRVKSWKHIPLQKKEELVQMVMDKYNITGDTAHVKKNTLLKIQKLYSDWRSKCHKHYKKVGRGDRAKRNPPEHFAGHIQDWVWLCDNIYENKKWKVKSAKYCVNRSKKKCNHRTGSMPYAQKRHQLKNPETNETPGAVDFFAIVHTGRNGVIDPAAKQIHLSMTEKMDAEENDEYPVQTQDDIAALTLGTKSMIVLANKCTTMANYPTHDRNTHSASSNVELQAKVEEQAEQIEAQRAIITDQAATILELQTQQTATNKIVSDMKGELTEIYRILGMRQNAGIGNEPQGFEQLCNQDICV